MGWTTAESCAQLLSVELLTYKLLCLFWWVESQLTIESMYVPIEFVTNIPHFLIRMGWATSDLVLLYNLFIWVEWQLWIIFWGVEQQLTQFNLILQQNIFWLEWKLMIEQHFLFAMGWATAVIILFCVGREFLIWVEWQHK